MVISGKFFVDEDLLLLTSDDWWWFYGDVMMFVDFWWFTMAYRKTDLIREIIVMYVWSFDFMMCLDVFRRESGPIQNHAIAYILIHTARHHVAGYHNGMFLMFTTRLNFTAHAWQESVLFAPNDKRQCLFIAGIDWRKKQISPHHPAGCVLLLQTAAPSLQSVCQLSQVSMATQRE